MHSTLVVQRILHNKKISQCHKICGGNNPKGFIGLWWYLSSFTVSYYSISSYSYDKTSQTALCGQCLINLSSMLFSHTRYLVEHGIKSSMPLFNYTHSAPNIFEVLSFVQITVKYFSQNTTTSFAAWIALAVFDIMALPTPTHLCYPEAKSLARQPFMVKQLELCKYFSPSTTIEAILVLLHPAVINHGNKSA